VAERKEIIRQGVERGEVTVAGQSERVQVAITWAGGSQTTGTLIRPAGRLEQLSYYPQLCARVRALVAEGHAAAAIATHLHAEGDRPPKRSARFDRQAVQDLIQRLDLRPHGPRRLPALALGADEWWVVDLAQALAMPQSDAWDGGSVTGWSPRPTARRCSRAA